MSCITTSGKPPCFPKGTQIQTPVGSQDISVLKVDDDVISYSKKEHKAATRKILKTVSCDNTTIWQIDLANGKSIRTTPIHSFLSCGQWEKAQDICKGFSIMQVKEDGSLEEAIVIASYETKDVETVYNIVVDVDYSFSADGALVHSFTYFRGIRELAWSLLSAFRKFSDLLHVVRDRPPGNNKCGESSVTYEGNCRAAGDGLQCAKVHP